jgi:hypothetical protein
MQKTQSQKTGFKRSNTMKSNVTMTRKNGMPSTQTLNFAKLAACLVLVIGLSASALAACGDSLSDMAAAAALHGLSSSQSSPTQPGTASSSDGPVNLSIVGLWHTYFTAGGQTIQEAFQVWNLGGTEIHNPNVDPRSGNICLGAWTNVGPNTYKLAHRVWWYDASGDFMGTIHLTEVVSVGKSGNTHRGSFALDFYDPSDNFLFEVAGKVTAERISVE